MSNIRLINNCMNQYQLLLCILSKIVHSIVYWNSKLMGVTPTK